MFTLKSPVQPMIPDLLVETVKSCLFLLCVYKTGGFFVLFEGLNSRTGTSYSHGFGRHFPRDGVFTPGYSPENHQEVDQG